MYIYVCVSMCVKRENVWKLYYNIIEIFKRKSPFCVNICDFRNLKVDNNFAYDFHKLLRENVNTDSCY